MKKIIFAMLAVLTLTACQYDREQEIAQEKKERDQLVQSINEYNANSFKNPVLVGETSDGSKVFRTHIKFLCDTCRYYDLKNHYIYNVNGVTSNNHTLNSGKYSIDTVDITINQDLTQEEILAAADKIRADMKQKEKEKH